MDNLWKKALILGLIGAVAGFVLCLIIIILTSDPNAEPVSVGMRVLYVAAGAFQGAIAMGTTVVYQIEKWSIARATVTHFVATFAAYFLMGYVQGWLEFGSVVFWITTAAMFVTYFIIWLTNYLSYKRTIHKMNEELEKLKKQ